MSTALKCIYSPKFYDRFSDIVKETIPLFDKKRFINLIFDKSWETRELKDRMRHTATVMHNFLPKNFEKATKTIEKIITRLRQNEFTGTSVEFMFFPDYIEVYGLDDFETSVNTFQFVTQFTSCEFAVRPFIIKYREQMIKQMYNWSFHENHKVRRLASEGARPRLPWAIAIPELKKNPTPILPILENLKNDPSECVRRSVANNLNDIAKDNPNIVIEIAKQWKGQSKETDALIKHSCRTLLKQGNPDILQYFELANNPKIEVSLLKIKTPKISIGEGLEFSFTIQNTDKKILTVRLEYGIHYLRQNGQLTKKVFKISERQIRPTEIINIQRKQSFRIITTRKFYAGQQKLSIIINGQEREISKFELTE